MKINRIALRLAIGERSQQEVADLAGVSRQTVSSVLNSGGANFRTILALARALNVKPTTLIHEDEL